MGWIVVVIRGGVTAALSPESIFSFFGIFGGVAGTKDIVCIGCVRARKRKVCVVEVFKKRDSNSKYKRRQTGLKVELATLASVWS